MDDCVACGRKNGFLVLTTINRGRFRLHTEYVCKQCWHWLARIEIEHGTD